MSYVLDTRLNHVGKSFLKKNRIERSKFGSTGHESFKKLETFHKFFIKSNAITSASSRNTIATATSTALNTVVSDSASTISNGLMIAGAVCNTFFFSTVAVAVFGINAICTVAIS